MNRDHELNVKISHVESKIAAFTSKLSDHTSKLTQAQEQVWKYEIEFEIAQKLSISPEELRKIDEKKNKQELDLLELQRKTFREDEQSLSVLKSVFETLIYERDGFDFE